MSLSVKLDDYCFLFKYCFSEELMYLTLGCSVWENCCIMLSFLKLHLFAEMRCDSPAPMPRHSYLIGQDFAFASSVLLVCEEGYRLNDHNIGAPNSTKLTCTSKRTWVPDVSNFVCLRKCSVFQCFGDRYG